MKKLLAILSILTLVYCGNDTSKTNTTITSIEPSQVAETPYVWDFSKQKKVTYTFSQTVNGVTTAGVEKLSNKTYMTGVGQLEIHVKENNLADLSLTNIDMKRVIYDQQGAPKDTMKVKAPPTNIQNMKPDGSYMGSNPNIFFEMLFPLPKKELKKGESYDISMQSPFNAYGTMLFAKGQNTLTFMGYEKIEGFNCAVLKGEIDISKLDIPENLKGEYKSATTGNATYYFDMQNKNYVGADIKVLMDVLINTESVDSNKTGRYMKMTSDNIYKIRLQKTEK